jgi:hypothetical protein
MQQRKTGTGGAYAPLSEILPAARVARYVRMTTGCACGSFCHMPMFTPFDRVILSQRLIVL